MYFWHSKKIIAPFVGLGLFFYYKSQTNIKVFAILSIFCIKFFPIKYVSSSIIREILSVCIQAKFKNSFLIKSLIFQSLDCSSSPVNFHLPVSASSIKTFLLLVTGENPQHKQTLRCSRWRYLQKSLIKSIQ